MGRRARPPDEGRLLQSVYYLYKFGSRLAAILPERAAYGLAHVLGTLKPRLSSRQARIVAENLACITGKTPQSPEVQALVVEAYRSYARYWLETFRYVRKGPDFFIERFRCHNPQLLDQVIEQHGGAIVVVGHLGNWDAAGAWVAARGGRLVTVAEVLKPRRLFEFFLEHRARLGMTIHPAQPRVVSQLVEAVRDGAVVAILGDRDLRNRGPEVQFFSHAVTFPPGPAVVALKTGVPLLVAGVYSVKHAEGRGWEAEISGPIEVESEPVDSPDPEDVRRLTQEVARHLERFVARRPEEWHVFRPFFRRPQSMGRGHEDRRSPQSPFEAPTGAA